ncbi:MAG: carbamoyltransferase HypF [Lachnospiraceae bacterium]|nr:carbamoyltransferase HypF [Lachnospiraceae bacterium]
MAPDAVYTKRIRVYGIVQGVGFRPTVSRHAMETGIRGSVCNKGPYVEIFAQGTEAEIAAFLDALEERPPRRAAILKIDCKDTETKTEFTEFSIIESEKTQGEIFVSPDIAICDDCKAEMENPSDRRYQHPFINCTCCGPRLTILDALPYDRERTSMKEFPMCPRCAEEYYSPETRRYDAQPVCCNDCGPEVYLVADAKMRRPGGPDRIHGRQAITEARRTILEGGIVAVKGIGGFHLCCDASNEEAVRLLRTRKKRPMKPFAVMMRDEETADRECWITSRQREILTGHQKPILLLDKKEGGKLCPSIAPDNPKVGVMLPYAPVQILLFDYDDGLQMPDVLVMTSGNISGAPICRDDEEAVRELSGLCDCILSHNRKIRIRCDDSVMDFYRDRPYMIRRSRGYAPLPYLLSLPLKGSVLAVGGELKNTFCIGTGSLFYPSSYIGDLADLRSVKALQETIGRMETLLEVRPQAVACDLHPKYNSTAVAEETGLPLIRIQHHYAHIVSCMAENDWSDPVIGVSFDGTGYGTDETIWGGEIMTADLSGFERKSSIRPFLQLGGDASSREGWRIAASMIYAVTGQRDRTIELLRQLDLCDEKTARFQIMMADKGINSILSTSAGRLFDGVSALLGIRKSSTFEGEAATALQFRAEAYAASVGQESSAASCGQESSVASGGQEFEIFEDFGEDLPLLDLTGERIVLNTDGLWKVLLEARLAGENPDKLAYYFHRTLARQICAACFRVSEDTGLRTAALSGGVFQNRLLLDLVRSELEEAGFRVLIHSLLPPNDGGIALGQAVAAMYRLQA